MSMWSRRICPDGRSIQWIRPCHVWTGYPWGCLVSLVYVLFPSGKVMSRPNWTNVRSPLSERWTLSRPASVCRPQMQCCPWKEEQRSWWGDPSNVGLHRILPSSLCIWFGEPVPIPSIDPVSGGLLDGRPSSQAFVNRRCSGGRGIIGMPVMTWCRQVHHRRWFWNVISKWIKVSRGRSRIPFMHACTRHNRKHCLWVRSLSEVSCPRRNIHHRIVRIVKVKASVIVWLIAVKPSSGGQSRPSWRRKRALM